VRRFTRIGLPVVAFVGVAASTALGPQAATPGVPAL